MLPKKFRLTVSHFVANPALAKSYHGTLVTISIKNSNFKNTRFVIVVPKRIDKRASKRHLAKRLMIETLRRQLIKIKEVSDVLIKVKRIIRKEDSTRLENEITQLFKRAGLIKE